MFGDNVKHEWTLSAYIFDTGFQSVTINRRGKQAVGMIEFKYGGIKSVGATFRDITRARNKEKLN